MNTASNILLVDDQPAKLLTYETILEELGENLIKVQSAREALEVLLHTDVALILLDVQMPDLDGFDLAAMIREHPRFVNTAIIFVSGVHLTDLDRLRGYSAGAVDYVPVPIVPELLRARVRVFVDLHRKGRQLERLNRELEERVTRRTADLEASNARLQESERRLQLALAAARAGAWEIEGAQSRWSPEVFGVLGLEPEERVPSADEFLRLVHPDDRTRVRTWLDTLTERLGGFELEFRVVRPRDERVIWLHTTGEISPGPAGHPIARGIHQDVTSRKLAELALAAEARRKDEFLATLSHELRNPLAPIANSVSLLQSGRLGDEARARALAVVHRQVTHLSRLVDDLLDMSRISRGDVILRPERVDLGAVIRAALESRSTRLGSHTLEIDLPDQGPTLDGDPVRLAQIFDNLLDNAEKYTPQGGRIEVGLRVLGDRAEVRITDTGIGIPKELQDQVFELFTQADRSSGRKGLGIGLAIVRRLVELHSGTVTLWSEGHGTGTEVRVILPCASAPLPERRSPERPSADAGRRRILVVDDNRDAADSTAEYLALVGHQVTTAYGGLEALERGAEFEPEFVLLDLGMPVLDGYQTARRMREQPWGRVAKVIAISGWGQPEDRKRTAESGFDGHLVKPVDLGALADLLTP